MVSVSIRFGLSRVDVGSFDRIRISMKERQIFFCFTIYPLGRDRRVRKT